MRSSISITMSAIVGTVFTAINSLFLAMILGPQGMGQVAVFIAFPTILTMVANSGLHSATVYLIRSGQFEAPDALSSVTWAGCALSLILSIPIWLARYQLAGFIEIPSPQIILLALTAVIPQMLILYYSDAAIGLDESRFAVLIRLLPGALYLVASLVLVPGLGLGVMGAITAYVFAIGSTALFGFVWLSFAGYIRLRINRHFLKDALAFGLQSYTGDTAQYLIFRLDLPLVGMFAGASAAGLYSIAVRLGELLWLPTNSIRTMLLSNAAGQQDESSAQLTAQMARLVLYAGSVGALLLAGGSYFLITLLLPNYTDSLSLLLLLIPGIVAATVFRIISGTITGLGKPQIMIQMNVTALFIAVTLYLLFIPHIGAFGAAIASSVVYIMQAILSIIIVAKLLKTPAHKFWLIQNDDIILLRNAIHKFEARPYDVRGLIPLLLDKARAQNRRRI